LDAGDVGRRAWFAGRTPFEKLGLGDDGRERGLEIVRGG